MFTMFLGERMDGDEKKSERKRERVRVKERKN